MKLSDEIRALPKEDQLEAALLILDTLTGVETDFVEHYRSRFGLQAQEAVVVNTLVTNAGKTVSVDKLYAAIEAINADTRSNANSIRTTICRARRNLPDGAIKTIPLLGYTIQPTMADFLKGDTSMNVWKNVAEVIPYGEGSAPDYELPFPPGAKTVTIEMEADTVLNVQTRDRNGEWITRFEVSSVMTKLDVENSPSLRLVPVDGAWYRATYKGPLQSIAAQCNVGTWPG